jgi:hypothetical protein
VLSALRYLAAAACASQAPQQGGSQVVLAVQTGVTDGYTTNRLEVNDEGLPLLHNLTGYLVRLVSVQWVNKPAAARPQRARRHLRGGQVRDCQRRRGPANRVPEPIRSKPDQCGNAVITPRHADSRWFVIAFTISKAGTYRMNRLKINYVTRGHHGWQYQYLHTKITVVNPPVPGPVPIPRSAICG